MADCALLFCGFSSDECIKVQHVLSEKLELDVDIMSTVSDENIFINQILDGIPNRFAQSNQRFIMFLGFDDTMISESLKAYPEKISRPVFCGLTENNLKWSTAYLMQHLLEEEQNMKNRGQ